MLRRALAVPAAMLAAAVSAGVVWRVVSPPPGRGEFGGDIAVGSPSLYSTGDVRRWAQGRFYLVRLADGFVALYQRCPHRGCPISPPQAGVFECKCHSSRFALDGANLTGPANRPMDLFPIRVEDGVLVVRTGARSAIARGRVDPAHTFAV